MHHHISPAHNNPLGNKAFVEMLYDVAEDARHRAISVRQGLLKELYAWGQRTSPDEVTKAVSIATMYAHRLGSLATLCEDTASSLVNLTLEFRELERREVERSEGTDEA